MSMFDIKKMLFGNSAPEQLPAAAQAALAAWREKKPPSLEAGHFQTRYLVVDIAASGEAADKHMSGIAAVAVHQGRMTPVDAFYADFADGAVAEKLLAFLGYAAKAPLVTYHAPYVSGLLQPACQEYLGVNFQPQWIDLAWLLPILFGKRGDAVQPLDYWLEKLSLNPGAGRRDAMENTLLLARLLQMTLAKATSKGFDTAATLIAESRASSLLGRVG
jgi:DNA polymerase-3 subunit epsilon